MSSTIPLPPREQLYDRYCSNKHTHAADSGKVTPLLTIQPQEKRAHTRLKSPGTRRPRVPAISRACAHFRFLGPCVKTSSSSPRPPAERRRRGAAGRQHNSARTGLTPVPTRERRASLAQSLQPPPHSRGGRWHFHPRDVKTGRRRRGARVGRHWLIRDSQPPVSVSRNGHFGQLCY
jgi:hypothetical protein